MTMTCKKCGSTNVDVQMVSSTEIKEKKPGILYWISRLGGVFRALLFCEKVV